MSIVILYGTLEDRRDVTEICLNSLTNNNVITIPRGDVNRSRFFSDHLPGIEKRIFIRIDEIDSEYDQKYIIKININSRIIDAKDDRETDRKIDNIHQRLRIHHGYFHDELPEQKMVVRYFTGNEKVLELGGNIGRNSLIIASIVNNNNFVTLESDVNSANKLEENRNLNNYTFHVEKSALSKQRLIQSGWTTKVSDVLEDGYFSVNTITLDELNLKYKIDFDTLVLDCEGAFYYILMDTPQILDNVKLIIMENDYQSIFHKYYVDCVLKKYNFYIDYSEDLVWEGQLRRNFYQVWKKE